MRTIVSTAFACLLLITASSVQAGTITCDFDRHGADHNEFGSDSLGDLVSHFAHHHGSFDGDFFGHHGPAYQLIQIFDPQHADQQVTFGHYLHALKHLLAHLFHHDHHQDWDDIVNAPPAGEAETPSLPPIPDLDLPPPGPSGPDDVLGDIPAAAELDALQTAPEPASLAIWGLGALGCAAYGYRRKKCAA
jgi:hypothetical protein